MDSFMTKARIICVAFLITFFTISLALGARKETTKKDETILGATSCTVAAVKAPVPAPGANPPQAATPDGSVPPSSATTVVPPPQPITTVKACLANGGKVVIVADGEHEALPIENPDVISGHEWQRLSISGYRNGYSFHVISVRRI
jgi:hypothetical protein